MDMRGSLSRLKKKVRHKISNKHKPDRTGDEFGGEGADEAGLFSQPVPHVVSTGGHSRENNETNADEQQARLADGPPPDVSTPAPARGSGDDQGGVEGGIGGGDQGYLYPHSDAKVMVGSGPSQKGIEVDRKIDGGVYPSPSTPSIAHNGGPDCTRMCSIY